MNRNQKGFGVVETIIVIVVLVLIGVGIWYVWQANNTRSTETQQSTSTSKALEISEFGIKINDPDGRNLQMHAQKVCGAECDTENSYFIRDNNEAYFTRCEYPVGISKVDGPVPAHLKDRVKNVGGQNFYVSGGTHFQAPCMYLEAGDEEYEDELTQYVLDNMVSL